MASSKLKMKLKLMVDTVGRKKVLFAEAGKDVVDFLFRILELPLGVVGWLLNDESTVGCLGKLYDSVERLEDTYVQNNRRKRHLLTPPKVAYRASSSTNAALIWKWNEDYDPCAYYQCASNNNNGCGYFSDASDVACPHCKATMRSVMKYVFPTGVGGEKGFVKGLVTYMVMDDLSVAPTSAISTIALLNKFGVKDVGSLEETTVELGMTEALAMLKASLTSTTVLTDVFLRKK